MWIKYRNEWAWGCDKWIFILVPDAYNTVRKLREIKLNLAEDKEYREKWRRITMRKVSDENVPGEIVEKLINKREERIKECREEIKRIKKDREYLNSLKKKTKKEIYWNKCVYCKGKGKKNQGNKCYACKNGKTRNYEIFNLFHF